MNVNVISDNIKSILSCWKYRWNFFEIGFCFIVFIVNRSSCLLFKGRIGKRFIIFKFILINVIKLR